MPVAGGFDGTVHPVEDFRMYARRQLFPVRGNGKDARALVTGPPCPNRTVGHIVDPVPVKMQIQGGDGTCSEHSVGQSPV